MRNRKLKADDLSFIQTRVVRGFCWDILESADSGLSLVPSVGQGRG